MFSGPGPTNCRQNLRGEALDTAPLAGGETRDRSNSILILPTVNRRDHVWFVHTSRFFSAVATASDLEWTRSFPQMLFEFRPMLLSAPIRV